MSASSSSQELLILFSKLPVPGKAKTRMIPLLGEQGAADLQEAMTKYVMRSMSQVGCDVQLRYTGGSAAQMATVFGDAIYVDQGEGDLGEKMCRSFAEAFGAGYERIVIVGADCPTADAACMRAALDALKTHDMVLGPAEDGGYYLIGFSKLHRIVFENIDWGSEQVFAQTMSHIEQNSIDFACLDTRSDIDNPDDILTWNKLVSG